MRPNVTECGGDGRSLTSSTRRGTACISGGSSGPSDIPGVAAMVPLQLVTADFTLSAASMHTACGTLRDVLA